MKNYPSMIPVISVKLNLLPLWEKKLGRKPIYRTFSSAKGAAREWAYRKALRFYNNRSVRMPFPAGQLVGFAYDQPDFQVIYDKAYRRSLKIFRKMGMK